MTGPSTGWRGWGGQGRGAQPGVPAEERELSRPRLQFQGSSGFGPSPTLCPRWLWKSLVPTDSSPLNTRPAARPPPHAAATEPTLTLPATRHHQVMLLIYYS